MQAVAASHVGNTADAEYEAFLARVHTRLLTSAAGKPLFQTSASEDLAEVYLDMFPTEDRQYHNCNACKQFLTRFGGLVLIDPKTGVQRSAMWNEDDAPAQYRRVVAFMAHYAARAVVTGPFLSSEPIWGQARTGIWRHFAATNPEPFERGGLLTAGQVMAERREDFKNMKRALQEFTAAMVHTAVTLLEGDDLYRSEKVLGPAKWLQQLHSDLAGKHGRLRDNIIWYAVATAPAGFAHPRSSMIGTLLEDIAAGKSYNEVARAFKAKMHPLQYQRPTAAPRAGAVAQAERTFEAMGAAASLQRRIARLDEVDMLWSPAAPKVPAGGIFGHLLDREASASALKVPRQDITFARFRRTVLPEATRIEVLMPIDRANFRALVTAVDPNAPPILQWDDRDFYRRNPVNSYVWHGGSLASAWGLRSRTWVNAAGVCLNPAHWYGNEEVFSHQVRWAMFLLEGARESRSAGLALFPETLRSEFHPVRSVIEAHSRSMRMQGMEEGSACGLEAVGATVRVISKGAVREYRIDRWD